MGSLTVYKGMYLPEIAGDSGVWGTYLNANTFPIIDRNLGGITSKSLASSNITLTNTESQSAILRFTGTLTKAITVTTYAQGFTFVENLTTGNTLTVTNGVAGVSIPSGQRLPIIADATNGVRVVQRSSIIPITEGGTGASTAADALANFGMTNTKLAFTSQSVTASTTSLTIDANNGWAVGLTLNSSVSTFSISNVPATGTFFRLVLDITNGGAYDITSYPASVYWAGGAPPTITSGAGKRDTIILTTTNGGTTYRGYIVAQDMS